MKKIIRNIATFLGAFVLALSLTSCAVDKSGAIKKAFEEENYTVTTIDESNEYVASWIESLDEEDQEKASQYEFISATKSLISWAIIVKYPSVDDLKEAYTVENDGEKDSSAYDEAVAEGSVNGNCLLVFTPDSESRNIFKNA